MRMMTIIKHSVTAALVILLLTLAACAGSTINFTNDNALTGRTEVTIYLPKTSTKPKPKLTDPHDVREHNGRTYWTYDVDGDGKPDWAFDPEKEKWFPIEVVDDGGPLELNGDGSNGGDSGGPGSNGHSLSVTGIRPAGVGSVSSIKAFGQIDGPGDPFALAMNRALANSFDDANSLPLPPEQDEIDFYNRFDLWDFEGPRSYDASWQAFSPDDNYAEVVLHFRGDDQIMPAGFYDVTYEILERDEPDALNLPGYVRMHVKGKLTAVLAIFADSGMTELDVDDQALGVTHHIEIDQDTRLIYFNGLPSSFYADQSPAGVI